MVFKAALFDLDGTLLDTLDDIADAANHILRRHGFPTHPTEAYRFFIGDGAGMLIRRSLPQDLLDESLIQECLDEWNEIYAVQWKMKTRPYPQIPAALDELAKRGVRLAILSNKPDSFTRQMAAELLPSWNFDHVMGSSPERPRKPNPQPALMISAEMGIPPAEFLYLGDSGVDMKTARAAGMFAVGALWGLRPADELLANGAQALLKSPLELLAYFPLRER